jgi:hypothetical protein
MRGQQGQHAARQVAAPQNPAPSFPHDFGGNPVCSFRVAPSNIARDIYSDNKSNIEMAAKPTRSLTRA